MISSNTFKEQESEQEETSKPADHAESAEYDFIRVDNNHEAEEFCLPKSNLPTSINMIKTENHRYNKSTTIPAQINHKADQEIFKSREKRITVVHEQSNSFFEDLHSIVL